ncbi:MAG TPA: hypothetical protein VFB59_01335 [Candidatus Saccharimonadales bacterium]|nr:hypothetical protein [Candidatus Saccharimonadales bacterium]
MGSVFFERRPLTGRDVLSWDIARHLYGRQLQGTVVILTDNPTGLHAALAKQWRRLGRAVQRERAATLDAVLIQELTRTLSRMQNLTFSTQSPFDELADVYILDKEHLNVVPRGTHTFYATEVMDDEQLKDIGEAVAYNGLVVTYR